MLLARQVGDNYEISFGNRRLEASKLAGLIELPLEVIEITDREMMENSILENSLREEVNPMERAQAIANYKDKYQLTDTEVGRFFGLSKSFIGENISLTKMPAAGQDYVLLGQIPPSTAILAHRIGGEELIKQAVENNYTREDIRDIGRGKLPVAEREKGSYSNKGTEHWGNNYWYKLSNLTEKTNEQYISIINGIEGVRGNEVVGGNIWIDSCKKQLLKLKENCEKYLLLFNDNNLLN